MNIRLWPGEKEAAPREPGVSEAVALLESCKNMADFNALLIQWYGCTSGFAANKDVAMAIVHHAPYICRALAETLVKNQRIAWAAMTDEKRVDPTVLAEYSRMVMAAISELDARVAQEKIDESQRKEEIRLRIMYVIANSQTVDRDLAFSVAMIKKWSIDATGLWVKIVNHNGAGFDTWLGMAGQAQDKEIARALVQNSKAVKYFIVTGALRFMADQYPDLLTGLASHGVMSGGVESSLREQWGWLVKNHPDELLRIKSNITDEFLNKLPKETLGVMMGSPNKEIRVWGVSAIALRGEIKKEQGIVR